VSAIESRADSVPNLTRRFQSQLKAQPGLLNDVEEVHRQATAVTADRRRTTLETAGAKPRQQPIAEARSWL
jgi:hypothetical protein